jgi:hypothetical protein
MASSPSPPRLQLLDAHYSFSLTQQQPAPLFLLPWSPRQPAGSSVSSPWRSLPAGRQRPLPGRRSLSSPPARAPTDLPSRERFFPARRGFSMDAPPARVNGSPTPSLLSAQPWLASLHGRRPATVAVGSSSSLCCPRLQQTGSSSFSHGCLPPLPPCCPTPSPSSQRLPRPHLHGRAAALLAPSFFFPLCSSKKPLLAALASNFAAQRCRSKTAALDPLRTACFTRSAQPQHRRRSPR